MNMEPFSGESLVFEPSAVAAKAENGLHFPLWESAMRILHYFDCPAWNLMPTGATEKQGSPPQMYAKEKQRRRE